MDVMEPALLGRFLDGDFVRVRRLPRKLGLAPLNRIEVVEKRLNGLDARVVAHAVGELWEERWRHPCCSGNGVKAARPSGPKMTLQVFDDRFHLRQI